MISLRVEPGGPIYRDRVNLSLPVSGFFGVEGWRLAPTSLWTTEKGLAVRLGIGAEARPNERLTHFKMPDGLAFEDAIREKMLLWFEQSEGTVDGMALGPGEYFPRLARPSAAHPHEMAHTYLFHSQLEDAAFALRTQLRLLLARLEHIFEVADPRPENMAVFGAETRNVILLACTEVEAQLRAVLKANGYPRLMAGVRLTTSDYVKVEPAARLGDYSVFFSNYPWMLPLAPFAGWDRDRATQSLPWYDTYNKIKHDREENWRLGTLQFAMQSVAAVLVMGIAQFGGAFFRGDARLQHAFEVSEYPRWTIGDCYYDDPRIPKSSQRVHRLYPFG